ncbi:MAG: hypothetical protein ACLPVW_15405 [Terriglobales bacterium]
MTVAYRGKAQQCQDELEFRQMLATILKAEETSKIVKALIAQARG